MNTLRKETGGQGALGQGLARDRYRLKLPLVIETRSGPPFELPSEPRLASAVTLDAQTIEDVDRCALRSV